MTTNHNAGLYENKIFQEFLKWMQDNGVVGLDEGNVEFRMTPQRGLCCYAQKSFIKGEIIFIIPQRCIISIADAKASDSVNYICNFAVQNGHQELITEEYMIWLFMCEQLHSDTSQFGPYLRTLDRERIPSPISWPNEQNECLTGTNLKYTCDNLKARLEEQSQISTSITLPKEAIKYQNKNDQFSTEFSKIFSFENLLWACSHYLSRRYPNHFATSPQNIHDDLSINNNNNNNNNNSNNNNNIVVNSTITSNDRSINTDITHEEGMEKIGVLCPLLDILNHNSSQEWLTFETKNNCLYVICNYPIVIGNEIYSNYGKRSNEELLFAYGFALPPLPPPPPEDTKTDSASITTTSIDYNTEDSVTMKMMCQQVDTKKVNCLGTYYLKPGGLAGVPKELFEVLTKTLYENEDSNPTPTNSNNVEWGTSGGDESRHRHSNRNSDNYPIALGYQQGNHSFRTMSELRYHHQDLGYEEEEEEGGALMYNEIAHTSRGNNSDEGEEEEEVEEEGLEIGLDECLLLQSWVQSKLTILEDTESKFQILWESFETANALPPPLDDTRDEIHPEDQNVEYIDGSSGEKRKRICSGSFNVKQQNLNSSNSNHNSDTGIAINNDSKDFRILYIKYYRDGQRAILQDLLQDIQSVILSARESNSNEE